MVNKRSSTGGRVNPTVRIMAWILGPSFVLVGILGIAALAFAIVNAEGFSTGSLIIVLFLGLVALSMGGLLIRTAWTGRDPYSDPMDEEAGP